MKTEITKNLEYYLTLPYGIALRRDDEGDWVAKIEELPGCTAHGSDGAEALANLEEVQMAWLEDALAAGDAIPEPSTSEGLPSGKWLQRVPRSLHRKLVELARKEGVSLNQFATSILAEAVGRRQVPSLSQLHSDPADLLWLSSPPGSFKAEWKLIQAKTFDLDIVDALAATNQMLLLPNKTAKFDFGKMSQSEWKGTAYAQKKEPAHKA